MATNDKSDNTTDNNDGEPIVITTEIGGGTVTWTPGPHDQMHLQTAADAGNLDNIIEQLKVVLEVQFTDVRATLCMANALGMLGGADDDEEAFVRRMVGAIAAGILDVESGQNFDEGFGAGYHPHSTDPRLN